MLGSTELKRIMTKFRYRSFVLLSFLFLFTGCKKRADIPLPDHPGGQLYSGLKRFDITCYKCHGNVGEGPLRGGSLEGPALVHSGKTIPREIFVKTVIEGKDRMPPYGTALKEEEILQIIDWLEKVSSTGTTSSKLGPSGGS